MEITIIRSTDPNELAAKVNTMLLVDGWELHGTVFTCPRISTSNQGLTETKVFNWYNQALKRVRRVEK